MSKQKESPKSRWRRFKNMNKRRVNMFLQEKRIINLETKLADEIKIANLNGKQINDLLKLLEQKVNSVIKTNQRLKTRVKKLERKNTTQQKSLFSKFIEFLCSKGEP